MDIGTDQGVSVIRGVCFYEKIEILALGNLRRREHFILPQRMAVWEQKAMLWMLSERMLWKRT